MCNFPKNNANISKKNWKNRGLPPPFSPYAAGGDTQAKKGDIVIQEIVKEENGNSVDVFNRFADFVQSDIWLTVRRDNQKAKRFYEKVNMKVVGEVVWSKGTLMGDVYKYSILTNN